MATRTMSEISARRNYNESFCFFEKKPEKFASRAAFKRDRSGSASRVWSTKFFMFTKDANQRNFSESGSDGLLWLIIKIRVLWGFRILKVFEKFWASDHGPQWGCGRLFNIRWFYNIFITCDNCEWYFLDKSAGSVKYIWTSGFI